MSYFLSKWGQCAILVLYKRIIELPFLGTMAREKQTVISSTSSSEESEEMEVSEKFEKREEERSCDDPTSP